MVEGSNGASVPTRVSDTPIQGERSGVGQAEGEVGGVEGNGRGGGDGETRAGCNVEGVGRGRQDIDHIAAAG